MFRFALALWVLLCAAVPCFGQSYPNRPVTLVTPFAAGSPQDLVARVLASELEKELRVPVVVENRPSAFGVPTVRALKDERPNGYTLLHGHDGQFGIMEAVYADPKLVLPDGKRKYELGYDMVKDFTPLGTFAQYRWLVVARKGLDVDSVSGLRVYAKAHRPLNIGTAIGPSPILLAAMLKAEMSLETAVLPRYRSDTDAMRDLVAGVIDLFPANTSGVLGQKDAVAPIGAVGVERNPFYPTLPTLAEQGLRSFALVPDTWTGLFCPGQCPAEVTAKLEPALAKAATNPEVIERLRKTGVEVRYRPAREVPALIKETVKAHKQLFGAAGVSVLQ